MVMVTWDDIEDANKHSYQIYINKKIVQIPTAIELGQEISFKSAPNQAPLQGGRIWVADGRDINLSNKYSGEWGYKASNANGLPVALKVITKNNREININVDFPEPIEQHFFTADDVKTLKDNDINLIYINGSLMTSPKLLKNNDRYYFMNLDLFGKEFESLILHDKDGNIIPVDIDGNRAIFQVIDNNFPVKFVSVTWVGDEPEPDPEPETEHFFTADDLQVLKENGINNIYINGSLLVGGRQLKNSDSVVLKNAEFFGKEFESLILHDKDGNVFPVELENDGAYFTIKNNYFPVKFVSVTWVGDEPEPDPEPEPNDSDLFNNLYSVNNVIMEKFTNESLNIIMAGGDELTERDYSGFIINCLLLPFSLPEGVVSEEVSILLGEKTLDVKAPVIIDDNVVYNLGTVSVPKGDSFLDYQTTVILLKLPFTTSIQLDINKVIGHDITVYYKVNLYDGETVVNVKSSGYSEYIESSVIKLGTGIPTVNYRREPTPLLSPAISLGLDNNRNNFSLEIIKNLEALPDNEFSIPVKDYGKLEGLSGYVTVENIELKGNISSSERDSLISLLNSGVFIND